MSCLHVIEPRQLGLKVSEGRQALAPCEGTSASQRKSYPESVKPRASDQRRDARERRHSCTWLARTNIFFEGVVSADICSVPLLVKDRIAKEARGIEDVSEHSAQVPHCKMRPGAAHVADANQLKTKLDG